MKILYCVSKVQKREVPFILKTLPLSVIKIWPRVLRIPTISTRQNLRMECSNCSFLRTTMLSRIRLSCASCLRRLGSFALITYQVVTARLTSTGILIGGTPFHDGKKCQTYRLQRQDEIFKEANKGFQSMEEKLVTGSNEVLKATSC